jgi:hypothetical protein
MLAVEADVVANLAVVEAHPPAGRDGAWDPLDKVAAVPHAVGKAYFNHGPSACQGWLHGSHSRFTPEP